MRIRNKCGFILRPQVLLSNFRHNKVLPVPTSPVILIKPSPASIAINNVLMRLLITLGGVIKTGVWRELKRKLVQAKMCKVHISYLLIGRGASLLTDAVKSACLQPNCPCLAPRWISTKSPTPTSRFADCVDGMLYQRP
jgi:hypothetical protein